LLLFIFPLLSLSDSEQLSSDSIVLASEWDGDSETENDAGLKAAKAVA
jgi:hypothetical protein